MFERSPARHERQAQERAEAGHGFGTSFHLGRAACLQHRLGKAPVAAAALARLRELVKSDAPFASVRKKSRRRSREGLFHHYANGVGETSNHD